jgi:hypothetical protein
MKHLSQDDAFQVQVLYSYILNIFPEFLVGNVLLHKERIFEMEESYHKYVPFLFKVGYVQTVYTKYLKIFQRVSIKHKAFLRLD